MIKSLAMLVASAMAVAATGVQALAPASIEGVWRAQVDNARIRIAPCGDKICGRLITSDRLKAFPDQRDAHNHDRSLRSRLLENTLIVQGFAGGPTRFIGGTVYDPAGGGTYGGRIVLTGPDTLQLTGCIVAPFCRTQTWTRIRPNATGG